MKTIFLDTALMAGITFAVGFTVAALIKGITSLFFLTQEHSLKEILRMWNHNSKKKTIHDMRIRVIAEKYENNFEIIDYSYSHNPKKTG